jgi:RNA polymerase sigma-70 factor (ECF subfamily)
MEDPVQLDAIVSRAQQGEQAAVRELIQAVEAELRRFVMARAPSLALADEIIQGALVTAIEQLHTYEQRGTCLSWIKGIAHNHLRTELRRLHRQVDLAPDRLDAIVIADAEAHLDDADERVYEHLRACIQALPERGRLMLERHYAGDVSVKRLAQQFKQNEKALGMTLFRLRDALRRCLAGKGVVA